MEKSKKKILYSVLTIVGVFLLLLGVTYAYWLITKQQTKENIITTGCLNFSLTNEENDIELLNAYPITDSEGKGLTPYTFTIQNECESYVSYDINLEVLGTSNIEDFQYINALLNEEAIEGTFDSLEQYPGATSTIEDAKASKTLKSDYLGPNVSKNYELRLWLDYDTPVDEAYMNKTFKSKIVVSGEYLDEETLPEAQLALSACEDAIVATTNEIKNKEIVKYEYQLDQEAWKEGEQTEVFAKMKSGSHTIKVRVTDANQFVSKEVSKEIELETYETPVNATLLGQEIPLVSSGNGLYRVSHCGTNGTIDNEGYSKEEYRYAGVNYSEEQSDYVHNYVTFNDELWRIIGLVNVKVPSEDGSSKIEQRVKLIRTNGISTQQDMGDFQWGEGIGNWNESKVKAMLNGIYFNSESGTCYRDMYGKESTCDFQTGGEDYPKGLNDGARNMIDEVILDTPIHESLKLSSYKLYNVERNQANIEGETSKLGVMYPSDYMYATSGGTVLRDVCLNTPLVMDYEDDESLEPYWGNSIYSSCAQTNWLNKEDEFFWTIYAYDDIFVALFVGNSSGGYSKNLGVLIPANGLAARIVLPTLYLKPTVTIQGGSGTYDAPYTLQ